MRAVVQRVSQASVDVDGQSVACIGSGLLVLLGIGREDTARDVEYLASKIGSLRVFTDDADKMNRSVLDISGEVLLVSQFTLLGDARRGNRPSFIDSMPPQEAVVLYEAMIQALELLGIPVSCGRFQAHMQVSLVNDGPVTILLDSKRVF